MSKYQLPVGHETDRGKGVFLWVSQAQHEWIGAQSKRLHTSRSEIVRSMIEHCLGELAEVKDEGLGN